LFAAIVMPLVTVPYCFAQAPATLKIIVPFPAGGAADIMMRILGEEIFRVQRVLTVVETRPGAASIVGTESAARAAPDGNTILVTANSFVINPSLRKLTYDPLTSFEPVCHVAATPMFIVVNSASPYRTLADLFAAARERPRELTLASLGPATAQHMAFEMLKRLAKIDLNFVPYPGNVPAINALMGGHVTSSLANFPDVIEHVRSGSLRALATTGKTRVGALAEVPTVAELGFPEYGADTWTGLVAPAKTPSEKISLLASWFTAALRDPEVNRKLVPYGIVPKTICGEEFRTFLRIQRDEYAQVIGTVGIKAE
jgi:tripartite-type tricarboxylate transporter receptor subunit TctC